MKNNCQVYPFDFSGGDDAKSYYSRRTLHTCHYAVATVREYGHRVTLLYYKVSTTVIAAERWRCELVCTARLLVCVCCAYSVGVCVGRVERPRRRLCLAGAFTTRRGLGGSPRTSPCDHREETGLIPGGRRYIRIEWSSAQSSCTFVPPPRSI